MDGNENAMFKQYFASWPSRNIVITAPKPSSENVGKYYNEIKSICNCIQTLAYLKINYFDMVK